MYIYIYRHIYIYIQAKFRHSGPRTRGCHAVVTRHHGSWDELFAWSSGAGCNDEPSDEKLFMHIRSP